MVMETVDSLGVYGEASDVLAMPNIWSEPFVPLAAVVAVGAVNDYSAAVWYVPHPQSAP